MRPRPVQRKDGSPTFPDTAPGRGRARVPYPAPVAGIDAARDPRGAAWERRLQRPVLTAAWLAIPTVLLYFSSLEGWLAVLALSLAWGIWLVFLAEATIMLTVARDRRAWARGHVCGLAKAAKLIKSAMILRASGAAPRHPALITAPALIGATALVGIGDRIVSGDKHPTPFHGTWDLVVDAVP